jgi:gliding motility-associated-like protein
MKRKVLILFTALFISNIEISAQLNTTTVGDAVDLGGNCFLITNTLQSQTGGVWYDNPIDFSNDFTINYQNNFGDHDYGADGMALVFKTTPDAVIGVAGAGLGYRSIKNSLIVEFDTHQNEILYRDPPQDHLSIMKNGNPDHDSLDNLAGPIVASSSNNNIEDGNFHEVKIAWDAATKELSVFFDCQLRLTITEDIKNTIFFGDSSVYFGFVGATGSASNLQQVCFNSISFVDNLVIPENETICLGQEINIDTTIPSGINYSWSPTTGVSDANIANPDFSPIETTDYTVTITDNCGELTNYTVTITVSSISTPIFTQIDPICSGEVLSDLPVISNNGITGTWLPAINNTAITTYTFAPDASETCVVIQSMTITVSSISTPIFTQIDPICSGEVLSDLPVTSNNGITGTWAPAMNNTATTTYTFIPGAGECSTDPAQMTVIVNAIITPTFTQVGAICAGEVLSDLPVISNSGITGTWSPALNNTATTTYTFTPDASEICAISQSMTITVNPIRTPAFTQVDAICSGEALSDLSVTSNNGITGTWLPAINNTATTTYTFTPDASETCVVSQSMTITVNPIRTPAFTQIDPICSGEALSDLPVTSNNGITGTWSPAMNNTATTTYTFIPGAGECSTDPAQMTVIVNAIITPTFTQVGAICAGEVLSDLPVISNSGITGTWSPALNNTATTTYSFVPDPGGSCAEPTTLEIVVNEIINLNMIVNVVASKFTNNQSIEVDVTNTNGSNEYKLNNGLWQDSNLFESLIVGKHIVAAREKSGCSIESNIWFLLIDYPRFFTPNNDGVNDTWNIAGLESQPEAVITVFDRYGKALSVFRADSLGWNGVSKGKGLPSASYWFKVQYFEMEKRPKTRISYFSLVR